MRGFDSRRSVVGRYGRHHFLHRRRRHVRAASCGSGVPGDYTVTATDTTGGIVTATATLHVTGPLDHLVISPPSPTIAAGASQAFTAEGFDSFGHDLGDVTATTTFTLVGGSCTGASCTSAGSGDHSVAAVNGTATGNASLHVDAAASTPTPAPSSRRRRTPSPTPSPTPSATPASSPGSASSGPQITPPPTSTGAERSSSDHPGQILAIVLLALFGGFLLAVSRSRRRALVRQTRVRAG